MKLKNSFFSDLWATLDRKEPPERLVNLDNPDPKDPLDLVEAMALATNAQLHDWRLDINCNRYSRKSKCNYKNIYDQLQPNFLYKNFQQNFSLLSTNFLSIFPFVSISFPLLLIGFGSLWIFFFYSLNTFFCLLNSFFYSFNLFSILWILFLLSFDFSKKSIVEFWWFCFRN